MTHVAELSKRLLDSVILLSLKKHNEESSIRIVGDCTNAKLTFPSTSPLPCLNTFIIQFNDIPRAKSIKYIRKLYNIPLEDGALITVNVDYNIERDANIGANMQHMVGCNTWQRWVRFRDRLIIVSAFAVFCWEPE